MRNLYKRVGKEFAAYEAVKPIRAMPDMNAIDHKLDAVIARLEAWQPHIDRIPMLQSAVEVLQRDMRALRGDITSLKDNGHVMFTMLQRFDNSLRNTLEELRAIHQWMVGINARVRRLEESR